MVMEPMQQKLASSQFDFGYTEQFYVPELSLIPRQVPDFNEQTSVSNGHPRCNTRIYHRFLPQLEKTHETFPSLRDEARFPWIVSRAIAFSQSNT